MTKQEIIAFWQELNDMNGTNYELPADLMEDLDSEKFQNDIICGRSFDSAMQSQMEG